jgi:hypothetical protein
MITSIPTFGSLRPELAILITAPVEFGGAETPLQCYF